MWEKRIGASGAIIAGGVAFIVLAVFLDRVSDEAAQWMQAGGTVLAFAGLLFVHWNEGRRQRAARANAAALAVSAIRNEMGVLGGIVQAFLEKNADSSDSVFFRVLRLNPTILQHADTDKFITLLTEDHHEAAVHALAAKNAAQVITSMIEVFDDSPRREARSACEDLLRLIVTKAALAVDGLK